MILEDKKKCCGCYSCINICPMKCIEMRIDNEGFWYPEIDKKKCIECGKCDKSCPVLKKINPKDENILEAYAFKNKNEKIRLLSSSGGIFTELANYVLDRKGVVFGAGFDKNWEVIHQKIESVDDLHKLRGSKYVQSKIMDTYNTARQYLEENYWVLFSGTPCQINGFKSYLKKDYEKLLLVDFICHGVPSPLVWEKYIQEHIKKNTNISGILFRDKEYGWKKVSLVIKYDDMSIYRKSLDKDPYMKGFLSDIDLRPSCYSCMFKDKKRISDFTMADFWGIGNIFPDLDDDKGVSLVIIHSSKAKNIFNNIKATLKQKIDIDIALKNNQAMTKSANKNIKRNAFFSELKYDDNKISVLIGKYTKMSMACKLYKFMCKIKHKFDNI